MRTSIRFESFESMYYLLSYYFWTLKPGSNSSILESKIEYGNPVNKIFDLLYTGFLLLAESNKRVATITFINERNCITSREWGIKVSQEMTSYLAQTPDGPKQDEYNILSVFNPCESENVAALYSIIKLKRVLMDPTNYISFVNPRLSSFKVERACYVGGVDIHPQQPGYHYLVMELRPFSICRTKLLTYYREVKHNLACAFTKTGKLNNFDIGTPLFMSTNELLGVAVLVKPRHAIFALVYNDVPLITEFRDRKEDPTGGSGEAPKKLFNAYFDSGSGADTTRVPYMNSTHPGHIGTSYLTDVGHMNPGQMGTPQLPNMRHMDPGHMGTPYQLNVSYMSPGQMGAPHLTDVTHMNPGHIGTPYLYNMSHMEAGQIDFPYLCNMSQMNLGQMSTPHLPDETYMNPGHMGTQYLPDMSQIDLGQMGTTHLPDIHHMNPGQMGTQYLPDMSQIDQSDIDAYYEREFGSNFPGHMSPQYTPDTDDSMSIVRPLKPIKTRSQQSSDAYQDYNGPHSARVSGTMFENLNVQAGIHVPNTARMTGVKPLKKATRGTRVNVRRNDPGYVKNILK